MQARDGKRFDFFFSVNAVFFPSLFFTLERMIWNGDDVGETEEKLWSFFDFAWCCQSCVVSSFNENGRGAQTTRTGENGKSWKSTSSGFMSLSRHIISPFRKAKGHCLWLLQEVRRDQA